VPVAELAGIEGFDDEVAEELRARARNYLAELDRKNETRWRELSVSEELAAVPGLTPQIVVKLGENEIKTLDDLGDLASDELVEILGDLASGITDPDAVIMAARAHWFDDDEAAAADTEAAAGEAAQSEGTDDGPAAGV
jgi:transcription termination/antitermination protein NusA